MKYWGENPRFRFAVLWAIGSLALACCGSKNTYVAPPPPKVVVAQPLQQPVTLYIYLTGNTGVLVLIVILLFLQDWRALLVPATTVPVICRYGGSWLYHQSTNAVRHRAGDRHRRR
jgi:hypothetical protein